MIITLDNLNKSQYSQWGIDRSEIKHLYHFEEMKELVKTKKFFDNYLKLKLNLWNQTFVAIIFKEITHR